MLWTIAKKEISEQFISVRFLVLTLICITLLPVSFFVSQREYENRISDYNRSLQLNKENLENINFAQIFAGDFSIKGYRPPSPLSVFASGLSDVMPRMLTAQKSGLTLLKGSSQDDSILITTGKIDFLFIMLIVFSLLAILFTFDAICGEKEQGTLRAALSNSIPRDSYILGKYIGTMVTLLLPFIGSLMVGLILLIVSGFPLSAGDILLRICLILFSAIIFVSIFSCIGLFVSSRVRNSKTSIVILLSIWILLIFVIPKGSSIIAKAFVSVESAEVVQLEKSLLRQNLELEKGKRIDEIAKELPQYSSNQSDPEENRRITEERNKVINPVRNEYAQKINDGLNRIEEKVSLKRTRQNSLALSLARISPATPFNQIVTNLSWTGEHTKKSFAASAQAYQAVLNQALFDHVFRDISPTGSIAMGISGNINLKELPVFHFKNAPLSETFNAIGLDLALMIFFSIVIFVLAYVSFLRYDIR